MRPVLLRIPFSHYCQKAEWGLTQAGIRYDTIDVGLTKMARFASITPTGLVPALIVGDGLIEGSDNILKWASQRQADGTPALYPRRHANAVRAWERWAGDQVGPVARREAYRVAYHHPWRFHSWWARPLVFASRPVVLGVLKHYKARRFDAADVDAVPAIVARIAKGLDHAKTGFLVTDHPTAADHAVAALARPLQYAAAARGYADLPGWDAVDAFIDRVRPRHSSRWKTRRIRERDWKTLRTITQPTG